MNMYGNVYVQIRIDGYAHLHEYILLYAYMFTYTHIHIYTCLYMYIHNLYKYSA